MGIDSVAIRLKNSSHIFVSGQVIDGFVDIQKNGDESSSGITIRLLGIAETSWTESYTVTHGSGKDERRETHYEHYRDSQTLIDGIMLLFGEGGNKQLLPSDHMSLPFSFKLPPDVSFPPPVSPPQGSIKYSLNVTVKLPWYKSDKTAYLPITILPLPLDLNTVPGADLPLTGEIEHYPDSCCCACCRCTGNPLKISASCQRRAILLGDFVLFTIEIINHSKTPILDLQCLLVKSWTVFASNHHRGTKVHYHTTPAAGLARLEGEIESQGGTAVWQFKFDVLPGLTPSFPHDSCKIIKMEYKFQVNAVYYTCCCKTCCKTNASLTLGPVTIGAIPLKGTETESRVATYGTLFKGPHGGQY